MLCGSGRILNYISYLNDSNVKRFCQPTYFINIVTVELFILSSKCFQQEKNDSSPEVVSFRTLWPPFFLLPVNKQRNSLEGKSINVQTFIVMAFLEVQTFQTVWWH